MASQELRSELPHRNHDLLCDGFQLSEIDEKAGRSLVAFWKLSCCLMHSGYPATR
jgi:hypothetical protein